MYQNRGTAIVPDTLSPTAERVFRYQVLLREDVPSIAVSKTVENLNAFLS